MSYGAEVTMLVETAKGMSMTTGDLIHPLVENIARLIVEADRGSAGARDGLVEIVRNDIDEAVVRYDQLRTRR